MSLCRYAAANALHQRLETPEVWVDVQTPLANVYWKTPDVWADLQVAYEKVFAA